VRTVVVGAVIGRTPSWAPLPVWPAGRAAAGVTQIPAAELAEAGLGRAAEGPRGEQRGPQDQQGEVQQRE